MRWYRALTYRRVEVGTDETRNPVFELQETEHPILIRTALWVPSHDSTSGNQFDMVRRTFLTKSKPELLEGIAAIKVSGVLYEVEDMTHEAASTAVRVKRCKDGL